MGKIDRNLTTAAAKGQQKRKCVGRRLYSSSDEALGKKKSLLEIRFTA